MKPCFERGDNNGTSILGMDWYGLRTQRSVLFLFLPIGVPDAKAHTAVTLTNELEN